MRLSNQDFEAREPQPLPTRLALAIRMRCIWLAGSRLLRQAKLRQQGKKPMLSESSHPERPQANLMQQGRYSIQRPRILRWAEEGPVGRLPQALPRSLSKITPLREELQDAKQFARRRKATTRRRMQHPAQRQLEPPQLGRVEWRWRRARPGGGCSSPGHPAVSPC